MTLVDFLDARIAEDELTANTAIEGPPDWHAIYSYRDVKDSDGHYVIFADSQYPTVGQAAHIARQSPARVLRHCEAGRGLIAEFLRLDALGDIPGRSATEEALKRFATIYSDHADFDQGWF